MVKKALYLGLLVLLLACGNSQKSSEHTEFEYVESGSSNDVDTLSPDQEERIIDVPPPPRTPDSPPPESMDYDNMRGFDPASEDDMPDNGMSRYMENDDEEGWY